VVVNNSDRSVVVSEAVVTNCDVIGIVSNDVVVISVAIAVCCDVIWRLSDDNVILVDVNKAVSDV
jgi:hypothetical protein